MKLEGKKVGFALAAVTLAVWIVCSLSVALFPDLTMSMTAHLFHLNPDMMGSGPGKMMGWDMDISSIAMGAMCWTGFAFLIGWLFSAIYNRLSTETKTVA